MSKMASDVVPEWPLRDIIYTGVVGSVMLAALLEWFLWLAAFIYCLVKAFQKAEHWSSRVLGLVVGFFFVGLRVIFLPIMVFTLPLPSAATKHFPIDLTRVLQWIAFYAFLVVLSVPWILCIYQHLTSTLGRKKKMKQILTEETAPKVVVVMPVFKEDVDVLVTAINSVVDCDYPPAAIHVFLSFDGDQVDELYLGTLKALGVPELKEPPVSIDIIYRGSQVTICRFPHGGKRNCQKMTFALIDKVYSQYIILRDDMFVLFIDSDCILDEVCIQNFMYDMQLSPKNKQNMLAMTGVITSTTKTHSLITLLQDIEYVHGQLFERSVESATGSVTCLPGALTMLRFSAFRRMAKFYFADNIGACGDLFDYGKCHLGEDRYLTHLFMVGAKKRFQIQMCTSAFCKTEAVQTYKSLLKQRRRWFLGFITNEVCMLTDWRIWRRYPALALLRFLQNTIRTTALLFFILVIALATTSKQVRDLPLQFIGVSLGLNWLMMVYFGFKIGRLKALLYPLMFIFNPFFNWFYLIYAIFTAGQRTWGGPRADAAKADATITPAEAVEKAENEGDDLNVIPETFIPAGVVRRRSAPLHPPRKLEGRFAAPDVDEDGYYNIDDPAQSDRPWLGESEVDSSRDSVDSFVLRAEALQLPRRLDAIIAEEERIGLNRADIAQRQRQQRQPPRVMGIFPRPGSPEMLRPSHPLRNASALSDLRSAGGMESHMSIEETLSQGTRSPTPMMQVPQMAVLHEEVVRPASDSESSIEGDLGIRQAPSVAQAVHPASRQQRNTGPPSKLKHVYKRLPPR